MNTSATELFYAQRVKRFLSDIVIPHRHDFIRSLREFMFCLNIAFAAGYGLFFYISRSQMSWVPRNDLGYYLRCSAIRVDDLLGITSKAAVSTSAVGRSDFPVHRIGLELAFSLTILSLALLFVSLLRFRRGSSTCSLTSERLGCTTALFLAPASYLLVSGLTWRWPTSPEELAVAPFWQNWLLTVFLIEIFGVGIVAASRKRPVSTSVVLCFLITHYAFWTLVLWPLNSIYLYQLSAPHILLAAPPLAGIAWLSDVKQKSENHVQRQTRPNWRWGLALGSLAIAPLLVLWLPPSGFSLAASRDMSSLEIRMSRGPCRGTCPIYEITIRGNGMVEYDGTEFVKIKGHQVSTISNEKLARVLRILDEAKFTRLEDRAFDWCFDSSSVAVWASVDGRSKRVTSDGNCVGASLGPQSRFVKAASEIDAALGSDQWASCNGHPCLRE